MPEDRPLDVRNVVPRERHALIFDTYMGLEPSLYYQLQAEHTGQFSWDYLEQGPEVWRVRVGRNA